MISIPKEHAMLIDVQYIKQNKKENTPDYLYLIWKDMRTQEKHLEVIPEPPMDIYFEKPEIRNHTYNKNYEHIENLEKRTCKYKDIVFKIAEDAGEEGKRMLTNIFQTKNYSALKQMYLYPYVYGADYDITAYYRIQYLRKFDNDNPKKLRKGFMDIECDSFDVLGMADPKDCPINAISLIDDSDNTVYLFALVDRQPPDPSLLQRIFKKKYKKHIEMYEHMHKEQHDIMEHPEKLINACPDMFDESFGVLDYKIYFYDDERKMLVHFWQLINKLKLDMIGIWNISFDIPYMMERLEVLGLNPTDVMCHPDFPVKQCWFKEDTRNYDIKNKSDFFFISSYTVFVDQMELYAAIRKGMSELRSYKLNVISELELKDSKLDYSDEADIKTLPYINFLKFLLYNMKDTLLQKGIESKTSDFDNMYVLSYQNATPYNKVFKQTVILRNVQYLSYLEQNLIPGENINVFNKDEEIKDEDDEDDEGFDGALVADPKYIDYIGMKLYGRATNNIFAYAIDMDMGAFYPNTIIGMNIDASTLIFKVELPICQYDIFNGEIPFNGITGDNFMAEDDAAKECIDNFQTKNYMSTGYKWLNMPSVSDIYEECKKRIV